MPIAAHKVVRDLGWIKTSERYLHAARAELADNPADRKLDELIRTAEQVVQLQRERLALIGAARSDRNSPHR